LQRALRLVELGGVGFQDTVDDQGDRAFRVARAVHAANVDLGVARLGRAGDDGDAGGELDEILGLDRAGALQGIGGEHRDRGRHVLQPLVLAAGGDDDAAVVTGRDTGLGDGLRRVLRQGRRGKRGEQRRSGEEVGVRKSHCILLFGGAGPMAGIANVTAGLFVPPWLTRLDRHKEYCIQIPQVKIQTFLRGNATEVLEKDVSRASDRAYEAIRSMILSGELPAGAQLAEEALAERCGVSRTPVREALRRLESDLLVTRTDTQRSFVATGRSTMWPMPLNCARFWKARRRGARQNG
jgi:hypothetical protein